MLQKIFPRTIRPDADGRFSAPYVDHPLFCANRMNYIRAARIIAKDFERLFDFIEPSDANLKTYSFEVLGLFSRTCFEVEANLKGILLDNKYHKDGKPLNAGDLNMKHYRKVEHSHLLSKYLVLFPRWSDGSGEFRPFKAWGAEVNEKLDWYQSYNHVKHDRQNCFSDANLENLCHSFAALIVLLSSQFWCEDPHAEFVLALGQSPALDGYFSSLVDGYYFQFDHEFDESDRYEIVEKNAVSFENFPYP
ncbi:MAG: hypothetical protein AAF636_01585 [Pseudomonadota bacterium]